MDRHRMHSLNVCGSAFERVEFLRSINEYCNKLVVVQKQILSLVSARNSHTKHSISWFL